MLAEARSGRSQEHAKAIVGTEFDRYRGRVVLVHKAVDHRRFGPVVVKFEPPLLAKICARVELPEGDPTGRISKVQFQIVPLDLEHEGLPGMENLHLNGPCQCAVPEYEETWLRQWSLARRAFGLWGKWIEVPRENTPLHAALSP